MEFPFWRLSQTPSLGINVATDGTAHFTYVCTQPALTAPCLQTKLTNQERVNSYHPYNHSLAQSEKLANMATTSCSFYGPSKISLLKALLCCSLPVVRTQDQLQDKLHTLLQVDAIQARPQLALLLDSYTLYF
jgi:hypothetical protein